MDVERAAAYAAALEKKQKAFDRIIEEWKKKCDDLSAELEAAQRDNRNLSTELFRAKTAQDELLEVSLGEAFVRSTLPYFHFQK